MVIRLLIMQAQQVQPVIVAVGRPHDRVDMELCWFVIGQEHAGVMIKLDEGHRALYPVYRIQSPVTFIEFDHHTGVFLTNDEPAKFHVHTIVRTPNGNDYGLDLLRLHYQQADHHH